MRKPNTKTKSAFRFHAKKVGLTYSCPVNKVDNPIASSEELRDLLTNEFGEMKYIVAEELHENLTRHYHAWCHFDKTIDSTDCHVFDFKGVHANIINKPGPGWMTYCKKDKEFITNIEKGPWAVALSLNSATEAIEHLWQHTPRDMALNGDRVERNIAARFAPTRTIPLYYGPYPKHYYPVGWDHRKHSLLLHGPPEMHKSQFAMYLLKHTVEGDIAFVKKNPELLKNINLPFVFDEVNMLNRDPDDSREITCVEMGGSVTARNVNAVIPPMLPRIFTANLEHPFRNPHESVYGRRLVSLAIVKLYDMSWDPMVETPEPWI